MKIDLNKTYRLDTGEAPMRVTNIASGWAAVEYLNSGVTNNIPINRLKEYNPPAPKETPVANQLFQIKDTEVYCHKLATDSAGRVVVEIKGTGEVRAVEADQLVEVLPYSVRVRFLGGDVSYHYWAKPGTVKVGDLIMIRVGSESKGGSYAEVTELDTKNARADKWLTGWHMGAANLKGEAE